MAQEVEGPSCTHKVTGLIPAPPETVNMSADWHFAQLLLPTVWECESELDDEAALLRALITTKEALYGCIMHHFPSKMPRTILSLKAEYYSRCKLEACVSACVSMSSWWS